MVNVTYSDFNDVMNIALGISAIIQEKILDAAIDCLNLFGNLEISNMAGVAGAKTVTLTQRERSAVLIAARAVYYGWYRNINPMAAGDVGVTPQNVFDNPNAMNTIKFAANMLNTYSFERY